MMYATYPRCSGPRLEVGFRSQANERKVDERGEKTGDNCFIPHSPFRDTCTAQKYQIVQFTFVSPTHVSKGWKRALS